MTTNKIKFQDCSTGFLRRLMMSTKLVDLPRGRIAEILAARAREERISNGARPQ